MHKHFFLIALLLTLSQPAIAGAEDTKTRPNKEEITNLMLQASRMSEQEKTGKVLQVLKDQANSQTPRSDFMFCTGLAYLGNYKAQMCVANAFENGLGIVEDLSEAYTWYELALGNKIADDADAKKVEADRDRVKERLISAYPHPTEDELNDLVNAQKTRIAHYQEQVKKAKN
jgi:hypothetical protein